MYPRKRIVESGTESPLNCKVPSHHQSLSGEAVQVPNTTEKEEEIILCANTIPLGVLPTHMTL